MSETEGPGTGSEPGDGPSAVLRAKYLDYCSAQVADALLVLSPDEIYVLAEAASSDAGLDANLSYEQVVRLATERISQDLGLPSFERWAEEYSADPTKYDEYLLGLWEAGLDEDVGS